MTSFGVPSGTAPDQLRTTPQARRVSQHPGHGLPGATHLDDRAASLYVHRMIDAATHIIARRRRMFAAGAVVRVSA